MIRISPLLVPAVMALSAAGSFSCATQDDSSAPGGAGPVSSNGGDGSSNGGRASLGGSGGTAANGDPGAGGFGGTSGSSVAGSTASADGGTAGTAVGGSGNSGTPGGGMAGTANGGGAAGTSGGAGNTSGGIGGSTMTGGTVDAWYEAESPDNEIDNGTERAQCAKTCAVVADNMSCCSGGGELRQLLGRGGTKNAGGGVTFKNVTVPTEGMYDVVWWFHCGKYDNWNDHNCGGAPYPGWLTFYDPKANPQPGCRPHLIAVNGVQQDGADHKTPFWQFPCFGGGWDILHAATTPLHLSAGKNQIRLGAPHIADLDGVDIDAIHVVSAGKGPAPVVPEPRAIAGDNGRK